MSSLLRLIASFNWITTHFRGWVESVSTELVCWFKLKHKSTRNQKDWVLAKVKHNQSDFCHVCSSTNYNNLKLGEGFFFLFSPYLNLHLMESLMIHKNDTRLCNFFQVLITENLKLVIFTLSLHSLISSQMPFCCVDWSFCMRKWLLPSHIAEVNLSINQLDLQVVMQENLQIIVVVDKFKIYTLYPVLPLEDVMWW